MKYDYDDIQYLGESSFGNPQDHWISLSLPEQNCHYMQFMFYTAPKHVTGKDMEEEGFRTVFDIKKSQVIPMNYTDKNRYIDFYVQQVIISVRNDYLKDEEAKRILENDLNLIEDMISIISAMTSQQAHQQQSYWNQEGIYTLGIIDPVAIMKSPIHGITFTDVLQDEKNISEEEALRMGIMSIADGEIPWWTYSNYTVHNITDSVLDYSQSGKMYRKAYIPVSIEKGKQNGRLTINGRSILGN